MGYTERLGGRQLREKMNSHKKFEGKTEKDFKNCLYCAKHAFFAAEVSRQIHPPKHFKTKVLKNFLSVLRDWKSYSRESRKLSHENCVFCKMSSFSTLFSKKGPHLLVSHSVTVHFLVLLSLVQHHYGNLQILSPICYHSLNLQGKE